MKLPSYDTEYGYGTNGRYGLTQAVRISAEADAGERTCDHLSPCVDIDPETPLPPS